MMAVFLQKGGNVSLTKSSPGLNQILIGLGWDARTTAGDDFDLDASAFMLTESGKVKDDKDFIFFNNLISQCRSVEHTGDNRIGAAEGDDEAIKINLPNVPSHVVKIIIAVDIYDADTRRQNFGQVSNAFMRVVNNSNSSEIARFDLSEDYSTETSMIFGEIYKHNEEWKFRAVGQGFSGGLLGLCHQFGVTTS
jgi:tellurium resistance protein TerD